MRRSLILAALVVLAACSKGGSGSNSAAAAGPPAPTPTGPPPKTPTLDVHSNPQGDSWLGARPNPNDPAQAPFDSNLDAPLINNLHQQQ